MVAVLESIVFLLATNLEVMAHAGVSLQRITVSGGLSVLDGLCQRLADISQLPVERAPQMEATIQGLAFLLINPQQAWVRQDKISRFVPQHNPALSDRYQRWSSALMSAVNATHQDD
jgi:glycerol kinase